ncbi:ArsR/SmtB family transcription factor [Cellulomonas dongxiuzhuiae]|uniref:Metalloregulator ArsR/SmtB family transcription factor n=1 Tax=Cellulomonas dongxiuzhuiae TaxID=2819979 RepID=A0ABX8GJW7_9CELL|nr:metalloregulator ArsR/SmtB family transcription factor [Cellulomonas dongxiuzhuiae]MBO3094941.1 winged helix-turn-helix transcriptional regulator [Cellulomonas dongxiuzhuiae]QWC15961.1 metalloregulator ArsR/SmtB family transcription factor [Cellulomonas dongxiuzhuiae]
MSTVRAGAARVDTVLAALAEPVRRRLLEHLGDDERTAGELVAAAGDEFGISQPATSQHLRVLRGAGVVTVRADGPRRLYRVEPQALSVVEDWLTGFLDPFAQPLDALETELARGRREVRRRDPSAGQVPEKSAS